jgi:sugar-specific transcriptional regulator TrmB
VTNQLIKQLKDIGLKQNESEIYLFLLQNGVSTPPQISKGTSIARTNCYNILKSLKEKGVIDEQHKGKKKTYISRNPESLKLNLERRLESADRLLPDLKAMYTIQKNKPSFHFYDGWSEVKTIYESMLTSKEICGVGSTENFMKTDETFFSWFNKKIGERKITLREIVPTSSKETSAKIIEGFVTENHFEYFIPPQYKKIPTDIMIWDDNIALISFDEPIFGTVITNEALSQTFKILLSIIWDRL